MPWPKGKPHPKSPEHCRLISEGLKGKKHSDARKQHASEIRRGVAPMHATRRAQEVNRARVYSPEHGHNISAAKKGKSFTPAHRAALSGAASKRLASGANFRIKGFYKDNAGAWHPFRSHLERACMEFLDARGLTFQYEPVEIPYVDAGGWCRVARPDFVVANQLVLEAKGKHLLKGYLAHPKHEATARYCREHGLTYKIVTDASELNVAVP